MRYLNFILILIGLLATDDINAQKQILGGNNSSQIKVSSSDNWKPFNGQDSTSAKSSINGDGMVFNNYNASVPNTGNKIKRVFIKP